MRETMENRGFLVVLAGISAAFLLILLPFWSAIFWACVMSLLFNPLQRRMVRIFKGRESLAALVTLLLGMVLVVIPVIAIVFAFINEGAQLYESIESREINPSEFINQIGTAVPSGSQSGREARSPARPIMAACDCAIISTPCNPFPNAP